MLTYINIKNIKKEATVLINILSWFVLGFIAGVIAKFIFPGKDGGGIIATSLLGILGAVVGGFIFRFFGYSGQTSFSVAGLLPATLGALVVLYVWKKILKR